VKPPPTAGAVSSLVPLPEMLSELAASGPSSKTVERNYDQAIAKLGTELDILQRVPIEDIFACWIAAARRSNRTAARWERDPRGRL